MSERFYEWGDVQTKLDNGRVVESGVVVCRDCGALVPSTYQCKGYHDAFHSRGDSPEEGK